MSLIETYYSRKQLIADNLNAVGVSDASVNDGLTTLANKILNASGGKTQTILTLNTPLVVYTDLFTVTGVLKDANDNIISGATIQLIWNDGSEHIATGTTDNDGVFSFTSTDPASVSSYSFQLFFAGDNDYNASNSSVVNVNTAKETSVMVITSPASGTVVSTDSVTVSGTLKDNDNTAMSGKSVSFSLNNVSAGTATVESDGSFSKTVTGLIAGSNSISASFAATTTHTAANQVITVNRSTFDGLADLELIAGNQILSYADEQQTPNSQYATLETQLMAGDSPAAIGGVEVGFWDFTDEFEPVLLGYDYSDSAGKASFTYHSSGVGDVPIKAVVGSIVSKTYDIVDGLLYRSGNVLIETPILINFPSKYEVSYKLLKKSTSLCVGTCNISDGTHILATGSFGSNASIGLGYYNGSSWSPLKTLTNINLNTEYLLTSVYDNGTFTTSINGQSDTISQSLNPTEISIGIANQTNIVFKDLLIKPL